MKPAIAVAGALWVAVSVACGVTNEEQSMPPPAPDERARGVLTFGSVSFDPAGEHEVFKPFADHVASQMGEVGIGRGRVVVVESINTMVDEIRRGAVDVFIDSPFPVGYVAQRAGTRVVLRRWKRQAKVYRGLLFARSDSGIEEPEDLLGRMVAFGAPFSTSSYLMPKAELGVMGFELVPYQDAAASVPDDRIGYVFSNDAETTLFWVLKGKVAAGAANRDYYPELAGSRSDELRVIYLTREIPRNLVSVRADLDPAVVSALTDILLRLDHSAEGRQVLHAFEETTKFDHVVDEMAARESVLAQLLRHVEEDLGQ